MTVDVSTWSETPASNTTVDGVGIDEGCSPGNLNNAIRSVMAGIKTFYLLVINSYVSLTGVQTLTNKTLTSPALTTPTITGGTIVPAATPTASDPGFLGLPQVSKTASYTLTMTDLFKEIYISGTTAAQTITIPANGSVAAPIGAYVAITNDSNQNWSIVITTDTLLWSPNNATGTRTLAAGGTATIRKVTATRWWIYGTGLT